MKDIIVVMPVANEEDTIAGLFDELLALPYPGLRIYPVIDCVSTDGTEAVIDRYEEETGRVRKQFFRESGGVASCYLYGFRKALGDGADYIVEMDAGGSHLPAELPRFIENLDKGYDCVFGSRFMKGGALRNDPLYRKLLSRGGTRLSNLVLGTSLTDMTSGFEAFRRGALERLRPDRFLSRGHIFQTEMRFYCRDLHYIEVPITYIFGGSSLRMKAVAEALGVLIQLKENEKRAVKGPGSESRLADRS